MNRCIAPNPLFRLLRWTASLLALLIAVSAVAQQSLRPFPAKAQRAVMQVTQHPTLRLNGVVEQLSPGARIHGKDNLIVMSDTLVGRQYLVNYVREPGGQIYEIWILTDAEAAQPLPVSP